MEKYIVTITKSLNKQEKVEVEAKSVSQILDLSETQFGLGIAPLKKSDIVLKSDLPVDQQSFYYRPINIHEEFFVY